jgi:hypothetical protein
MFKTRGGYVRMAYNVSIANMDFPSFSIAYLTGTSLAQLSLL